MRTTHDLTTEASARIGWLKEKNTTPHSNLGPLLRTIDGLCGTSCDSKDKLSAREVGRLYAAYGNPKGWEKTRLRRISPKYFKTFIRILYLRQTTLGPRSTEDNIFWDLCALLRGYLEVLMDHGVDLGIDTPKSVLTFFVHTCQWSSADFVKYTKYCLAAPTAAFLRNDLPPRPEGCGSYIPFTGCLRRYLRLRIHSGSPKSAKLMFSILQIKRACNPVPESFVAKTLRDHADILSSQPDVIPVEIQERFIDKFKNFWQGVRGSKIPRAGSEASTNASYEFSRGKGGQRMAVQLGAVDSSEFLVHESLPYRLLLRTSDLLSMKETRPGVVQEDRGVWVDGSSTLDEAFVLASRGPLPVKVCPVIEPLKVRVITKGSALPYYQATRLQKLMLQHLRKFEQFRALVGPLDTTDIINLKLKSYPGFDKWVSGDYSSATDLINMTLTKLCFEVFLEHIEDINPRLAAIGRRVLYEQELHYDYRGEKESVKLKVLQTMGQLMGSVLSFPILCVINFTCKWLADEEYFGRKLRVTEVQALINGDDIGFKSNDAHYQIWQKYITYAGFKLSIGKNYLHDRYFTINSMLFDTVRECSIPFFNVGLLTGQSKLTGRNEARTLPSWDWFNACIGDASSPIRATQRFLHYHAPWIKRITMDGLLNLFISKSFGGCGFLAPTGYKWSTTKFQRAVAYKLFISKRSYYRLSKQPTSVVSIVQKSEPLNLHRLKRSTRRIYTWSPWVGPLEEFHDRVSNEVSSDLTRFWSPNEDDPDFLTDVPVLPNGAWSELRDQLKLTKRLRLVQARAPRADLLEEFQVRTTL